MWGRGGWSEARVGRRAYDAGRSADPADESRGAGTPTGNKGMARKAGFKEAALFSMQTVGRRNKGEKAKRRLEMSGERVKDAPRAFALVVGRAYGATGFRLGVAGGLAAGPKAEELRGAARGWSRGTPFKT